MFDHAFKGLIIAIGTAFGEVIGISGAQKIIMASPFNHVLSIINHDIRGSDHFKPVLLHDNGGVFVNSNTEYLRMSMEDFKEVPLAVTSCRC